MLLIYCLLVDCFVINILFASGFFVINILFKDVIHCVIHCDVIHCDVIHCDIADGLSWVLSDQEPLCTSIHWVLTHGTHSYLDIRGNIIIYNNMHIVIILN